MPELVEVENFRQLMLRLVHDNNHSSSNNNNNNNDNPQLLQTKKDSCSCLTIELPSPTPPKIFPSPSEFKIIQNCIVTNVERKGKLLRLVLEPMSTDCPDEGVQTTVWVDHIQQQKPPYLYLYFHMGMTGRISCPDHIPSLESLTLSEDFPPPHTHLILGRVNSHPPRQQQKLQQQEQEQQQPETMCPTTTNTTKCASVAFSDPRRFGAVSLGGPLSLQWDEFAPDALSHNVQDFVTKVSGQKKGIKSLLLDQRAVVSGVGNWIADEILYQTKIHPDQRFLTKKEAASLSECLSRILKTGIECLSMHQDYPSDWLFHRRWNKGKGATPKDAHGRNIVYISSGGRTSAIVPAIQKIQSVKNRKPTTDNQEKEEEKEEDEDEMILLKDTDHADASNKSITPHDKKKSTTHGRKVGAIKKQKTHKHDVSRSGDSIVRRRSKRIANGKSIEMM